MRWWRNLSIDIFEVAHICSAPPDSNALLYQPTCFLSLRWHLCICFLLILLFVIHDGGSLDILKIWSVFGLYQDIDNNQQFLSSVFGQFQFQFYFVKLFSLIGNPGKIVAVIGSGSMRKSRRNFKLGRPLITSQVPQPTCSWR